MSKSARTRDDHPADGGNFYAPSRDANAVWLEGVVRAGQVCARGFTEWNREAVRFAQTRLDTNNDAAARLGACKNFSDLAALQQSWASEAAEAYMSEAARLATLGLRMMTESLTAMSRPVEKFARPSDV